jgi:hypothetical protein
METLSGELCRFRLQWQTNRLDVASRAGLVHFVVVRVAFRRCSRCTHCTQLLVRLLDLHKLVGIARTAIGVRGAQSSEVCPPQ